MEYVTPKTLGERLNLTERTIQRWCEAGVLESYMVGSRLRIPLVAARRQIAFQDCLCEREVGLAEL